MHTSTRIPTFVALPILLALAGTSSPALAVMAARQPATEPTPAPAPAPAPAAPAPAQPALAPAAPGAPVDAPAPTPADALQPASITPPVEIKYDDLNRRILPGEPTKLSFKQVTVEQLIPFIVESTGKVVLPQQEVLARRITLLNDKPIPRSQALDLVFLALQQAGVAVIENNDLIMLRDQADVDRQSVPVIGGNRSILERTDLGTIVQKVFAVNNGSATAIGEVIKPSIPDYAKIAVDADSNQILVTGPIVFLQRIERVVAALDRPASAALQTETFRLKFSDAEQIAQNIRDLFSDSAGAGARRTGAAAGGNQQQNVQAAIRQFQGGNQQNGNRAGGQAGGASAASTTANLRVTSNTQQNSVTVLAEASVLDQVRSMIAEQWDKQLAEQAAVPRVYQLKNTDPIKIRDVLEKLFNAGTTGAAQQGGGGRTNQASVSRLAGQFSFEAIPDAARLVVISRSPENFPMIDQIIEDLDQPISSALPEIVELKHATAEDLAEQLNALLAQEGTLAQVRRVDTELRTSQTSASPFSSNADSAAATQADPNAAAAGNLQFWWARGRAPTDSAGSGNLVSKARIVPVTRQNAVMVLAPLEYKKSIVELINRLDRPGRQVLISAVIAEVSLDDSTSLGTRFSNSAITPTLSDNVVGFSGGRNSAGQNQQAFSATKNNILSGLFDNSVLNVGADINVIIQALASKAKVAILSEPRIFTGDNQQAEFFDGQDIAFITNSQTPTGANSNVVNSFDYKAVGIALRVRPRITPERDVDLKVNLQLSSIDPSRTIQNQAVIDRRETTTQLIVKDGQTVVISGILRSEDSDVKRKVPVVGDIPLLNFFFSSSERIKTNTELVAFITPVVVINGADADKINADARKRLGELREDMRDPETAKKREEERKLLEGKDSPPPPIMDTPGS